MTCWVATGTTGTSRFNAWWGNDAHGSCWWCSITQYPLIFRRQEQTVQHPRPPRPSRGPGNTGNLLRIPGGFVLSYHCLLAAWAKYSFPILPAGWSSWVENPPRCRSVPTGCCGRVMDHLPIMHLGWHPYDVTNGSILTRLVMDHQTHRCLWFKQA